MRKTELGADADADADAGGALELLSEVWAGRVTVSALSDSSAPGSAPAPTLHWTRKPDGKWSGRAHFGAAVSERPSDEGTVAVIYGGAGSQARGLTCPRILIGPGSAQVGSSSAGSGASYSSPCVSDLGHCACP